MHFQHHLVLFFFLYIDGVTNGFYGLALDGLSLVLIFGFIVLSLWFDVLSVFVGVIDWQYMHWSLLLLVIVCLVG